MRSENQLKDIATRVSALKWNWKGYVAAQHNDQWSNKVTRWRSWVKRRSAGRTKQRCYDDLKMTEGLNNGDKGRQRA